MMINGHSLKIDGDTLIYQGQQYSLAGAQASYAETRRGIPLVSRRTLTTVTITAPGFCITGRARMLLFPAFRPGAVRREVADINRRAAGAGRLGHHL